MSKNASQSNLTTQYEKGNERKLKKLRFNKESVSDKSFSNVSNENELTNNVNTNNIQIVEVTDSKRINHFKDRKIFEQLILL